MYEGQVLSMAYLKAILHAGYIAPAANRNLLILYLGAALGVFGMSFLDVFMSVNLYSHGMWALVSYFMVRVVGNAIIGMPVGFHLISKCTPRTLLKIGALYLACTITPLVLLQGHIPNYVTAALTSLIYVPFWLVYHSSMLEYSSSHNRGNEVAVGHLCMALGCIVGGALAGVAMYYDMMFFQGCLIGFTLVTAATLSLITFAQRNNLFHKSGHEDAQACCIRDALSHDKQLTALTVLGSTHSFATTALWPVWLTVIGASGLAVGILYAATVGLKLIISPLVGHFANLRKSSDLTTGTWIQAAGWLPWLFSMNPMTTLISSAFFSGGSHFFNVGLETRWYDNKTLTHLAAREITLGLGRLLGIAIIVPILFLSPDNFVLAGLVMCSLIGACIAKIKS